MHTARCPTNLIFSIKFDYYDYRLRLTDDLIQHVGREMRSLPPRPYRLGFIYIYVYIYVYILGTLPAGTDLLGDGQPDPEDGVFVRNHAV
jgi:hypothetical protein